MLVRVNDAYRARPGGGAPLLAGVNLTIEAGEWVGLLGTNGAGKSTLARVIAGLIDVDRGSVAVREGVRCSLVPQDPWAQIIAGRVADDVAFAVSALGLAPGEVEQRVTHALQQMGIVDLAWRDPASLSGGQLQRVAIAGALATQPHLLIMDEPTAFLDAAARFELRARVAELTAQGMAVMWITQRADELPWMTRVVGLEQGQVIAECSPWELAQDANAATRLGIGEPAATRCARRLRDAGVLSGALPMDVDGLLEMICASGGGDLHR